jgi:hypothetical protein
MSRISAASRPSTRMPETDPNHLSFGSRHTPGSWSSVLIASAQRRRYPRQDVSPRPHPLAHVRDTRCARPRGVLGRRADCGGVCGVGACPVDLVVQVGPIDFFCTARGEVKGQAPSAIELNIDVHAIVGVDSGFGVGVGVGVGATEHPQRSDHVVFTLRSQ